MSSKGTSAMGEENKEKSALVPWLRFPEFRDVGDWDCEFGGEVFDQVSNKDHNSDLPVLAITQEHGAVPRSLIDYHVSVADKSIEGYKVVEVGDFIISLRSFQGGIEYSNYKGICSPAYVILRLKSEYSTDYFRHLLKMDRFISQLTKNLEGLRDGKMVSYKQFSELQLPTPSQKEQKKIADCLSFLDELITAETQKLDALKTHRKGLMQQLFPREGETVPRRRFPEFREAGEWEEQSISDFGEVITGSTPSTAHPEFYGGGIPFVSPADISDLRWVNDTKTTLTTLGFGETRPIKANSVLFVCIGSTIGKATQNVRDCATNQQINSVIPNAKHSSGFVYYTLSLNAERIAKLAGIQAVPIINKTQFSAVRLPAPKLPEQERIVDCLASLDDLIAAQGQKIDALKTHKKGLMQQLFPVLDKAQA